MACAAAGYLGMWCVWMVYLARLLPWLLLPLLSISWALIFPGLGQHY